MGNLYTQYTLTIASAVYSDALAVSTRHLPADDGDNVAGSAARMCVSG